MFTAKKGKTVTSSRRIQAKGEMCTLQTGKLCSNAIIINYVLVPSCVCAELQDNSVSRLSWSFVKEFIVSSYRLSYAQPCIIDTGYRKSTKFWELHTDSRIELELAWSKVSTKVCGFTFGSILLHLVTKRIKEIITQKHQYNAKYLSCFNDEIASGNKKKSIYFFQISALCIGLYVCTCKPHSW